MTLPLVNQFEVWISERYPDYTVADLSRKELKEFLDERGIEWEDASLNRFFDSVQRAFLSSWRIADMRRDESIQEDSLLVIVNDPDHPNCGEVGRISGVQLSRAAVDGQHLKIDLGGDQFVFAAPIQVLPVSAESQDHDEFTTLKASILSAIRHDGGSRTRSSMNDTYFGDDATLDRALDELVSQGLLVVDEGEYYLAGHLESKEESQSPGAREKLRLILSDANVLAGFGEFVGDEQIDAFMSTKGIRDEIVDIWDDWYVHRVSDSDADEIIGQISGAIWDSDNVDYTNESSTTPSDFDVAHPRDEDGTFTGKDDRHRALHSMHQYAKGESVVRQVTDDSGTHNVWTVERRDGEFYVGDNILLTHGDIDVDTPRTLQDLHAAIYDLVQVDDKYKDNDEFEYGDQIVAAIRGGYHVVGREGVDYAKSLESKVDEAAGLEGFIAQDKGESVELKDGRKGKIEEVIDFGHAMIALDDGTYLVVGWDDFWFDTYESRKRRVRTVSEALVDRVILGESVESVINRSVGIVESDLDGDRLNASVVGKGPAQVGSRVTDDSGKLGTVLVRYAELGVYKVQFDDGSIETVPGMELKFEGRSRKVEATDVDLETDVEDMKDDLKSSLEAILTQVNEMRKVVDSYRPDIPNSQHIDAEIEKIISSVHVIRSTLGKESEDDDE